MSLRLAVGLALLLPAAAPMAAGAAERVRPVGATGPLITEKLSDERRITRVAHPVEFGRIRARPSRGARTVGHLRLETEDGVRELYLVLRSRVVKGSGTWVKIRIPGRPNGRTGWVERFRLDRMRTIRTHLRVNRRTLRATLYRKGRRIWSSRIGVGAARTPTPRGRFYVRERLRALGGVYGPWAFGTSAYSVLSDWPGGGVIGIHGTNQPELIPGRPSHGCIRVPNHKIERLRRLMPVGTPVRIL